MPRRVKAALVASADLMEIPERILGITPAFKPESEKLFLSKSAVAVGARYDESEPSDTNKSHTETVEAEAVIAFKELIIKI